jgi:hypothetical protein
MVLSSKKMEKVQNEAGEVSRKEVVKLIKKDSKNYL